MFISEENEQLSQQLDAQEVGSLARSSPRTQGAAENSWREHLQTFEMMTPEEQPCTVSERAKFIRTSSEGMYDTTGEDVNDGFGNFVASYREYASSLGPSDSEEKLWTYMYTEIGPEFLMSRLSVIITYMESRFRSPLHLETTPKFGWSYPEAQTVTWMSCDTEIQKIFQKMLLTIVCKIKIKSIHKFKGQVTAFLFVVTLTTSDGRHSTKAKKKNVGKLPKQRVRASLDSSQ